MRYMNIARHRTVTKLLYIGLCLSLFFAASLPGEPVAYAQQVPVKNAPLPQQSSSVDISTLTPESVDLEILLLGIQPEVPWDDALIQLQNQGYQIQKAWPELGIVAVQVVPQLSGQSTRDARTMLNILEQQRQRISTMPFVRYAAYDTRVYAAGVSASVLPAPRNQQTGSQPDLSGEVVVDRIPNDPMLNEQWALRNMKVIDAWDISQGGSDTVVAVIDSGYDVSHEDVGDQSLWHNEAELNGEPGVDDDQNGFIDDFHGWDWVENDSITNDPLGHGTHVGATIAATAGNKTGISGVGRNLKILPLRILDVDGSGFIHDLIDALNYAHHKGIRIVNLSLVLQTESQPLHDAIIEAYNHDTLIVAASGNIGSRVYWPAAYPETMAVAATDRNDERGSFSNFGPEVDVAAPGVDILSAYSNNTYFTNTGTSMATPHVSALAGLIWSLRPNWSRQQVQELIEQTADDVNIARSPGKDDEIGHGRINFYRSVSQAATGLQMRPAQSNNKIVFAGDPVTMQINVSAPLASEAAHIIEGVSDTPSMGTVVHYRLVPVADGFESPINVNGGINISNVGEDDVNSAIVGRALSNQEGVAEIAFLAPTVPGQYTVYSQVGQLISEQPLAVQEKPSALHIQPSADVIPVENGTTLVQIEILDDAGALIVGEVPLTLSTDLGTFVNGQQSLSVMAVGGAYVAMLYASIESGEATITASAGGQTAQYDVHIKSATPAQIENSLNLQSLNPTLGVNSTEVTFTIYDNFGNLAEDGTQIQIYTNGGVLSSELVETENGQGVVTLSVGPSQKEAVTVWAVVLGTSLQAEINVPVLEHQIWFPFVFANTELGGQAWYLPYQ